MYGPKRPLFTSSGEPHLGHFSVSSPDRSCTSWMILLMSIASSARLNGIQNSQHRLPVEVALFDLVQLVFHVRREPDLEDFRKRSLQHSPDGLALRSGLKAAVLGSRIPPRAKRGNDGRIGRRPADPQPLQF